MTESLVRFGCSLSHPEGSDLAGALAGLARDIAAGTRRTERTAHPLETGIAGIRARPVDVTGGLPDITRAPL